MEINLLQRAQVLLEQKRYKEASDILKDLVSANPENPSILSLYSQVCIELNRIDEALDLINSAISIRPDEDFYYYIKARIFLEKENLAEADRNVDEAIHIDPEFSEYYGIKAHIQLRRKKFNEALRLADKALELEPRNEMALNIRSTALMKLGNKEESFQTIEGALQEDPNNSYTHANYGWNLLEKGETKKALKHFSEALKNDPNNEYAQGGMVQALKARYLIYRWFLKYSFWMSNLSGRNQWFVIIGFLVVYRIIRRTAENSESLRPFLTPIVILLAIVAFSTWIISPVSNLLLRINPFGRHLLNEEEIKSSNYVGISAIVAILGLLAYFASGDDRFLPISIISVLMFVPLGLFYTKTVYKYAIPAYSIGLAIVGLLSILITMQTGVLYNGLSLVFLIGFVAFQWLANFIMIKEDNPS